MRINLWHHTISCPVNITNIQIFSSYLGAHSNRKKKKSPLWALWQLCKTQNSLFHHTALKVRWESWQHKLVPWKILVWMQQAFFCTKNTQKSKNIYTHSCMCKYCWNSENIHFDKHMLGIKLQLTVP